MKSDEDVRVLIKDLKKKLKYFIVVFFKLFIYNI